MKNILGDRYLNYFNRIGRNLKEDETIFFNPSLENGGPKLNKSVRKKIILSVGEETTYKDNFAITALITSIDKADKTFTLLVDSQKIPAKLDHKFYKTIINTFNEYDSNTHVFLQGEGIYSKNDKLIKINSIDTMDILDPLDVSVRLSELSKLKDGWYNSDGIAPDKRGLIAFEKMFDDWFDEKAPLPAIFPTVEGNIQLEWTINSKEISLEVNLKNFSSQMMSIDSGTKKLLEEILDLNIESNWNLLTQHLS